MKNWRTVAADVPLKAINLMAEQLSDVGQDVRFDDGGLSGIVDGPSGLMRFRWEAGRLDVRVESDHGHFPELMLIGGIRQFVEEAIERAQGAAA